MKNYYSNSIGEKKIMRNKKNIRLIIFFCLFLGLFFLQGCQNKVHEDKKTVKSHETQQATGGAEGEDTGYIYGKVKETMNSGGYTYMLLEFEGKDFWVAVPEMKVAVGQEVMLLPGDTMKNFHSNSLNRTFDTIIFSRGLASGQGMGSTEATQTSQEGHAGVPKLAKWDIHVTPAKGENAITVEMAYKKAKELDGKKVVLKAQVVKISKNILGKNWLHVQDGTGSMKDKDFDLTVTTHSAPQVGAIVTIEGTLHKDKDIGAGYFYPVIIEDAKITATK